MDVYWFVATLTDQKGNLVGSFLSILSLLINPRICVGDFNEITCQSEKVSATLRPYKQMERFHEVLDFCSLNVILTKGPKFTWTNTKRDKGFTKEKLYRVVTNSEWNQHFPNSHCNVLPASKSNHSPLQIVHDEKEIGLMRKTFLFRYKASLNLKEDCSKFVKNAWQKAYQGSIEG